MDPGTRIAMDITGCSQPSISGRKYVHVKMDFGSGKKWVTFMKKKCEAVKDGLKFVERKNGDPFWSRNLICKTG